MDVVHSPTSSPRVRPEGIPEGLILPGSGNQESENSQFNRLEHNTALLQTAAAAAGNPASAVLLQSQLTAAPTGIPVPAVLQSQPMEGDTDSLVPPEMFKPQHESAHYSSAESDMDSFNQKFGKIYCTDIREKKKKQRHERKSSNVPVTDSSTDAEAMKAPKLPLIKVDVPKTSHTFLWNSGGKKAQVPKDITPPKKMVIEGVTIYIQILTSEEARNCGIFDWDAVLADSKRFRSQNWGVLGWLVSQSCDVQEAQNSNNFHTFQSNTRSFSESCRIHQHHNTVQTLQVSMLPKGSVLVPRALPSHRQRNL